jgi:hypothetical protein
MSGGRGQEGDHESRRLACLSLHIVEGFFHPADGYFEQYLERCAMVKPQ